MVKVTDSRLGYHEFEPSAAEDPSCAGGSCTLKLSSLDRPPVGGMRKLGKMMTTQVSSSSLDHGSKL
ncbi:hypothetical protein TNCV_2527181 [Trichonephila clavipes]|nr:hypothetical protein TNCV_2527181 [Trichonephila clavipes]